MSETWREYRLTLGMPFLLPGKLSEVELIKHLGAFQWRSVAAIAGLPENAICNEAGSRLHFSMITFELGYEPSSFWPGSAWEAFDEGSELFIQHRLRVFGKKLVEGLFVWDSRPIPESLLSAIQSPEALRACGRPWACLTHGFVTESGATWAKLETPQAFLARPLPDLSERPQGITRHLEVERAAAISELRLGTSAAPESGIELSALLPGRIDYAVVPESDVNALGQVYCARFPAIMGYGERRFLRERVADPLSSPLLECLATEHRELFYFSNALPEDRLQIAVRAQVFPALGAQPPAKQRTPLRFVFRTNLYRAADGALMARAVTRRSLNVPGHLKPVLSEAERLLAHLQPATP